MDIETPNPCQVDTETPNPHQVDTETPNPHHVDHEQVDPRPEGTRRLMRLAITSPPANQKNIQELITHPTNRINKEEDLKWREEVGKGSGSSNT